MTGCQSYREGCCGCCVNMRWRPERVHAYVAANTQTFKARVGGASRPRFADLVRIHWQRGGWQEHLLVTLLAPLTLGITAWIWMRYYGSCCFAGYLDDTGRVGCLIHPARVGEPDLRRHAFPLVLVLGCNRKLRCPMLDQDQADLATGWLETSRRGFASLHRGFRQNGQN